MPIAETALISVKDFEGDPRIVITQVLKLLAARLGEAEVLAIPKLIIREVVNFPELAEMYRHEVLDRVLPVVEGLLAKGMREGYLRPLDPELTVRSIIGPLILHLLMAEVFRLVPEDGLALDRLIENHLKILFDGLSLRGGLERTVR